MDWKAKTHTILNSYSRGIPSNLPNGTIAKATVITRGTKYSTDVVEKNASNIYELSDCLVATNSTKIIKFRNHVMFYSTPTILFDEDRQAIFSGSEYKICVDFFKNKVLWPLISNLKSYIASKSNVYIVKELNSRLELEEIKLTVDVIQRLNKVNGIKL